MMTCFIRVYKLSDFVSNKKVKKEPLSAPYPLRYSFLYDTNHKSIITFRSNCLNGCGIDAFVF
jgi:hypothetical protein